jgi:hypothetical protein
MSTETESTTHAKPKRRWIRFSLRSLLVAVLLIAAILGYARHCVREKHRIYKEIWEFGGGFHVEYVWYEWIEEMFATAHWRENGYFGELTRVALTDTSVDDDWLRQLAAFRSLERLQLGGCEDVGDAGLESISGLHSLEFLELYHTGVTDDGLSHLRDLQELRMLILFGTRITDDGLRHLRGLKKLEGLDVSETKVTPAGVESLRRHLPNCDIYLGEP